LVHAGMKILLKIREGTLYLPVVLPLLWIPGV